MSLTDAWTQLRYHERQARLWRSKAKVCIVAAGRGSGKTELARRRIVRFLPVKKPWQDPIYFYALPTRDQAKRVAWKPLKALVPTEWISSISESELIIRTVFGSELHLLGMDKPQRAEGVQWDGGVLDESSDQKPGIYELNLGPAMTHRDPWLWRIGVPKRMGVGAAEFKDAFYRALNSTSGRQEAYTWPSSTVLDPEVIAERRNSLDPIDFAEQYEASWETAGGAVFHAFSEEHNVVEDLKRHYNPNAPLIIGQDFNVDPMAWTICQQANNRQYLWQFDEVYLRNTNTQKSLDYLWMKYGNRHKGEWWFVGDASGRARKTSAALSDYLIIKNDERFKPKRVLYNKANPRILDRFAACNALFMNAAGKARYKVDASCTHTIADLNHRAFKPGTRETDDSGDVGHASDALGYVIHRFYAIALRTSSTISVFTG